MESYKEQSGNQIATMARNRGRNIGCCLVSASACLFSAPVLSFRDILDFFCSHPSNTRRMFQCVRCPQQALHELLTYDERI